MKTPDSASRRRQVLAVVTLIILAVVIVVLLWPDVYRQAEVALPVNPSSTQAVLQEAVPLIVAPASQEAAVSEEPKPAETPVEVPKPEPWKYIVQKGDKLNVVFGKDADAVCELSKLKDCDRIYPKQELSVPDGVKAIAHKQVHRLADGSLPIAKLNVDPYGPYRTADKDRKVLEAHGYTADEIDEYLTLRAAGKYVREEFPRGTKFPWMVFGKTPSTLEHLVAVWKQLEAGLVYVLRSGRVVVVMEKCGNLTEVAPRPPKTIAPPPVEPRLPPKEETPQEPPRKDVIAERYDPDYDLAEYAGMDPDVVFAGFEGAYYPRPKSVATGRHAVGVGIKGDWWDGHTSTDFQYDGYALAPGLAYKWSGKDRRDVNLKLLFGRVKENGHQGAYESEQLYRSVCLASNYTDASREREGKKALPEWTFWMNYCQLKAKSYGHTWQGQPIADTSELGKSTALLSIGFRLYLHRDLETAGVASGDVARKLQPFFELGGNQELPMDPSGHAYLGVRTSDKIWTFGAGPHFSHLGTVVGAGITHDGGRAMKMSIENVRWQESYKALKAEGIDLD